MRTVFAFGLLGAACLIACGSSSKGGGGPGASGGDGSGGDGSSGAESVAGNAGATHKAGASSTGDAGDGNGSGGEAGASDLPPPVVSSAKPHAAGGLVAGGTVGHSAHFTGVFSLGAAPGGNGLTTSKTQQLRGGVLGASQQ